MPKRNKLSKFAEIITFANVYQNYDPKEPKIVGVDLQEIDLKGQWSKTHFKNQNPLTLELACGGGEYTLALAEMYPNRNFIGVDIKGARIWKGARKAIAEERTNAAFFRTRIEQINLFFEKEEVDEIWITFPDPFLKDSKENRRLTSAAFLDRYKSILKKGGLIHLKTDAPSLYTFTHEILKGYEGAEILYSKADIYKEALEFEELRFKTYYENMHLEDGRLIYYIRFTIT